MCLSNGIYRSLSITQSHASVVYAFDLYKLNEHSYTFKHFYLVLYSNDRYIKCNMLRSLLFTQYCLILFLFIFFVVDLNKILLFFWILFSFPFQLVRSKARNICFDFGLTFYQQCFKTFQNNYYHSDIYYIRYVSNGFVR